jgi:hypothetical protein
MASEEHSGERLQQLRRRIDHWRAARRKHGPMPADLWDEATTLARRFGASHVSRALGVGYEPLQQRVQTGRAEVISKPSVTGFLELSGAQLAGTTVGGAMVELVGCDGARMTITLPAGSVVDVAAVVQAFRRLG